MQSKGPKGQRLCHSLASEDPHKLVSFEDPVFDPELNQWDLRHTGTLALVTSTPVSYSYTSCVDLLVALLMVDFYM